jgi:uncharacterized protein YebE (UPF0316 family)
MDTSDFFSSPLFAWVLLPFLIFCARLVDVTLGTFRIIFISRGMKYLAAIVGFFEIFIWLVAIGQVFQNLTNIGCYIAYAAGFASGNFLGIFIADEMSLGKVVVRIITLHPTDQLKHYLKQRKFGFTSVPAQGAAGPVTLVFTVIKRNNLPEIVASVQRLTPGAFYTVEDVRYASEGVFPEAITFWDKCSLDLFRSFRKAK